jgi:arylsulfatase A-like enzyme
VRRAPARLLLAILSLAGCGARPGPPYDNAVIVVVDALRADHLSCYGHPRPTSPSIDALAARGTRFAQAVSPAPWTLPAMATLWTGLLPSVHGAMRASDMHAWIEGRPNFRPTSVLDDSRTTLAEVLRAHGVATAAFVAGSYPSAVFGMNQGFETFVDRGLFGPRMQVEALWSWLDATPHPRFFAYLHVMSVHSPYEPPTPDLRAMPPGEQGAAVSAALVEERRRWTELAFDPEYAGAIDGSWQTLQQIKRLGLPPPPDLAHLVALYDQGIRYTDHWIGELAAGLEARGLAGTTLLIITADHGEELGDHGGIAHGRTVWNEVLHIPLAVKFPKGGRPAALPARIERVTQTIDLYPGLLRAAGLEPGPGIAGHDPFAPAARQEIAFAQAPGIWSLLDFPLKVVVFEKKRRAALFDLVADRGEKVDLAAARGDELRRLVRLGEGLQKVLPKLGAAEPESDLALDPEMVEQLRSLGYIQ